MNITQYIVDAFTDKPFKGNPAAVCILENNIPDETMQNIAMENNLSETAFILKDGNNYNLRWFTPSTEVDLCGHATLAASYVIFNYINKNLENINFQTKGGQLTVNRINEYYKMNFPIFELNPVKVTESIIEAIGKTPIAAFLGRDLLCIMEDEKDIFELSPNIEKVKKLDGLILHVSAPGSKYDCVSRSFAPKCNIIEDPVCGSGHCHIVPYWSKIFNKKKIKAYQASARSGVLYCEIEGDRISIQGNAAIYSKSELYNVL